MILSPLFPAFIAAVVALMLIPGPNVAVITANSIAWGTRYGLLTVAGTSAAMVPQLCVAAFGMTAMLGALAAWFEVLRWIGVAYLIWLGVAAWRAPPADLTRIGAQPRSLRAIWLRGFVVSFTNPKTLLFYAAFLPQFVDPARDAGPQFATLAVTFVLIAVAVDCLWALLAGRLRSLLAARGRLRNRLTGGLFIGAGMGLAFARIRP